MTSQISDPFNSLVVTDPWSATPVDVASIHRAVFNACIATLEQVRQLTDMPTRSILIYGGAGSGKTHLIRRLRQAVAEDHSRHPAIFCCVRLATSPTMIRRHVRRSLATDLLRPDSFGVSQLDRILLTRLCRREASSKAARRFIDDLAASANDQRELATAVASLAEEVNLGWNFAKACEYWLLRKHRLVVTEWFRDGSIPDDIRTELGFNPEPIGSDDDSELAAEEMILKWSRLISMVRPLVLCFDQIEALLPGDGDARGLTEFGRFVANLYEGARRTLLVTCVQTAFQPLIEREIREGDLDRLAGEVLEIAPLTVAECETMAAAYLDGTADLKSHERRRTDPLWPIDRSRIKKLCPHGTCTARRLIAFCRDAVRAWRSGKPIDAPKPAPEAKQFLLTEFEQRRDQYLGRVDDSQTTLAHGLPELMSLRGRATIEQSPRPELIDCSLTTDGKKVLVSVCNQKHNSLPARLKRLQESNLPLGQLVLVRDSTRPIPTASKVARQRWTELQKSGARVVHPTVEALAALEALRKLLSDAKAGDLSNDGQTVEPRTVEEWVRKHLIEEPLEQLTAEVMHPQSEIIQHTGNGVAVPGPQVDELFNDLLDEMQRRHVAPADELAAVLKAGAVEIVACAESHPAEFGLIGEPPTLVFEKCVVASQEGS